MSTDSPNPDNIGVGPESKSRLKRLQGEDIALIAELTSQPTVSPIVSEVGERVNEIMPWVPSGEGFADSHSVQVGFSFPDLERVPLLKFVNDPRAVPLTDASYQTLERGKPVMRKAEIIDLFTTDVVLKSMTEGPVRDAHMTRLQALPDEITAENYYDFFEELAALCVISDYRINAADIAPKVKTVMHNGVPLKSDLKNLSAVFAPMKRFEVAVQEVFRTLQQRLGIPTVDRQKLVSDLSTLTSQIINDFYRKHQANITDQGRCAQAQCNIMNLLEELIAAMPDTVDFLQTRVICAKGFNAFKAILTAMTCLPAYQPSLREGALSGLEAYILCVNAFIQTQFPGAPPCIVKKETSVESSATPLAVEGGPEAQEKFITRAEVIDRLMKALHISDTAPSGKSNDPNYSTILRKGIEANAPENIRQLADLGPAIYFMLGRNVSIEMEHKKYREPKFVKQYEAFNTVNAKTILSIIRGICVDINCVEDFDRFFPTYEWCKLPEGFDVGPTMQRVDFIGGLRKASMDVVQSLSRNGFDLSNAQKSRISAFILSSVAKLQKFSQKYCHTEISFGQIDAIFGYLSEIYSTMNVAVIGISEVTLNSVHEAIAEAITDYANTRIISLQGGVAATLPVTDGSTADDEVFCKKIQSGLIKDPWRIERAPITTEEIFVLLEQELSTAFPAAYQTVWREKLLSDVRTQCEGKSLQTILAVLSSRCLDLPLRVLCLDIEDQETLEILCPGGRRVTKPIGDFGAAILDESRERERIFQRICHFVQERMGLQTVHCGAFRETLNERLKSHEIITSGKAIQRRVQAKQLFDDMVSVENFGTMLTELFPQKLDIFQARYYFEVLHCCLRAIACCAKKINSTRGAAVKRQLDAFVLEIDEILAEHFPDKEIYDVEHSPSETPINSGAVSNVSKGASDSGLEGVGPMSREALIAEFCDAVSRASFLKDERELNVRESKAAIEHDCLETIYTIHDLHQFLLWFGTEMACFRNSHRSELTPSSLDILDDDEIAIHFAPLFSKIGERFGVQSFSLSPASIASIAKITGTPIVAQRALSQIINIIKSDNVEAKIAQIPDRLSDPDVYALQAAINFYLDDIKALLQNFFNAWLKDGIRSFSELNMVKTLISSSFAEIAQNVQKSETVVISNSVGSLLQILNAQFTQVYSSWERSLQTPANISTEEKDVIDTSPWYANTTLEHSFEEGLDSTLASGKLTDEYLTSSMNVIVENTAGTPQLMSESDISDATFTEQIEAFRSAALAVVVDLTNPARPVKEKPIQPQTINAPEQYQRLVAGLGYAVDTVSAEPLRRHFAKELLQWFAECEAQRMETNDVVIAYNKALGVLAAENADALEALWKSDEGQASLEAFNVFVAAAERFCASLKDSMTVQEVTLCLRAIREIFAPAVAEILRADATLGAKIAVEHAAALQEIEGLFNPPPTE